jgi:hypothetical protein
MMSPNTNAWNRLRYGLYAPFYDGVVRRLERGRAGVFDKFLPDGARPSLLRRAAGVVANAVATDLNRQLGPLLREGGLVLVRREPALLGGLFVAALARKHDAPP